MFTKNHSKPVSLITVIIFYLIWIVYVLMGLSLFCSSGGDLADLFIIENLIQKTSMPIWIFLFGSIVLLGLAKYYLFRWFKSRTSFSRTSA